MKNRHSIFFTLRLVMAACFLCLFYNPHAGAAFLPKRKAVIDSPETQKPEQIKTHLQDIFKKQKDKLTKFATPSYNSISDSTSPMSEQDTSKLKKFYDKKALQLYKLKHPDHKLKNGIFGKLALYCGLLSVVSLILAFVITAPAFGAFNAVLYALGFFGGLVFGGIGITRRKNRGKAIIGLSIILLQILLFAALASFVSAIAVAAPAIFEILIIIMFMGRH